MNTNPSKRIGIWLRVSTEDQVLPLKPISNEPRSGEQWALEKINAASAWVRTLGSAKVIVAVVDTGVDYNHEDLKANMWVNAKEIPNNGIDDDADGYIDNYWGWNVAYNDNYVGGPALLHGNFVTGITSNNLLIIRQVIQPIKMDQHNTPYITPFKGIK